MITGGELSKEKISFQIDHKYSPLVLRGMFTGHSSFFTVPPFDEKIDAQMEDDTISFVKSSGKDFVYEEIAGIIKKVCSFAKITSEEAKGLMINARDMVPAHVTYFFPDNKKPYLEIGFYYNWVRIDFYFAKFPECCERLKEVLSKAFEKTYKVFSNNIDDISIYNWDNSCILMKRTHLALLAEVLQSFGLLSPPHIDQFNKDVVDFGIKVYAFTEAADTFKKLGGMISESSDDYTNQCLKYFLELLSNLSKTGRIIDLEKHQQKFLQVMKTDRHKPQEFCAVEAIAEGIRNVVTKLAEEIEMAGVIRPVGSEVDLDDYLPKKADKKGKKLKKIAKEG